MLENYTFPFSVIPYSSEEESFPAMKSSEHILLLYYNFLLLFLLICVLFPFADTHIILLYFIFKALSLWAFPAFRIVVQLTFHKRYYYEGTCHPTAYISNFKPTLTHYRFIEVRACIWCLSLPVLGLSLSSVSSNSLIL